MADIYCKGTVPATANASAFYTVEDRTLHVPYKTTELYKNATERNVFSNIVEELPLVTVMKSIENAGDVFGEGSYQVEDKAEITASANPGYAFSGWYENEKLVGDDATYSFTVTDNHEFTALFVPVKDENTVEVTSESRDVSFEIPPVDGATSYTLEVYSDEDMTNFVCSTTKQTQAQLSKAFRATAMSSIGIDIDGLDDNSQYYYKITAFSPVNVVLSQFTGSFKTGTSTGIGKAPESGNVYITARYDAFGRKIDAPTKGINIIRYSDGSTRKVIK